MIYAMINSLRLRAQDAQSKMILLLIAGLAIGTSGSSDELHGNMLFIDETLTTGDVTIMFMDMNAILIVIPSESGPDRTYNYNAGNEADWSVYPIGGKDEFRHVVKVKNSEDRSLTLQFKLGQDETTKFMTDAKRTGDLTKLLARQRLIQQGTTRPRRGQDAPSALRGNIFKKRVPDHKMVKGMKRWKATLIFPPQLENQGIEIDCIPNAISIFMMRLCVGACGPTQLNSNTWTYRNIPATSMGSVRERNIASMKKRGWTISYDPKKNQCSHMVDVSHLATQTEQKIGFITEGDASEFEQLLGFVGKTGASKRKN